MQRDISRRNPLAWLKPSNLAQLAVATLSTLGYARPLDTYASNRSASALPWPHPMGSRPTHAGGRTLLNAPDVPAPYAQTAMYGCPTNFYSMPVNQGHGRYNLVPDLGSGAAVFFDADCQTCPPVTPGFTPDASDKPVGTGSMTYGLFSGSGTEYQTRIAPQGAPWVTHTILDIEQMQSGFARVPPCDGSEAGFNGFDGIFGLNTADLIAGPDTYMKSANIPLIAMQFCDTGGTLFWGGLDKQTTLNAPQFIDMMNNPDTGYATINLLGIDVQGTDGLMLQSSDAAGLPMVVDTGSTLFYLPESYANTLVATLQAKARPGIDTRFLASNDHCADLGSPADVDAAFAPLTIALGGWTQGRIDVTAAASKSYLAPKRIGNGTFWCSSIKSSGEYAALPTTFGVPMLRDFVMVYAPHDKALGFAAQNTSTCPKNAAVAPEGNTDINAVVSPASAEPSASASSSHHITAIILGASLGAGGGLILATAGALIARRVWRRPTPTAQTPTDQATVS